MDVSKCQACQMEEGTEKHRLYHCSEWHAVGREIPEAFRKCEQKAKMSKEWKSQRGIVAHTLSESQWNRGHFSMKKWESEKHKRVVRASRRLGRPRGRRWVLVREGWKVVSMWLGSGAVGLR